VPRARLNGSGGKTTEWKRSYAGATGYRFGGNPIPKA
jgi:hypothetical protein